MPPDLGGTMVDSPSPEPEPPPAAAPVEAPPNLGETRVGYTSPERALPVGAPPVEAPATVTQGPSPAATQVLSPRGSTPPAGPAVTQVLSPPAAAQPAVPAVTQVLSPRASTPPAVPAVTQVLSPRPSTPPTGPAAFKGTMLGMGFSPPDPAARPTSSAPPAPAAPAPAAPAPGPANLKGTMIGLAPPEPVPPKAPEPQGASAPPLARQGTMIGMAPPAAFVPAAPGGEPPARPAAEAPVSKKTIMGVARPGIAPLRPGVEKPRLPEGPPVPAWPMPEPPAPPPPPVADPLMETVAGAPRPFRIPTLAALAMVGAAALFTAAVVALLLYRSRGTITAELAASPDGRETLSLACAGCTDDSKVRFAGREATFHGTRATLELAEPLRVGENRVKVELERRPGRSEEVELHVPVDFRVRADTATLTQAPPRVTVRVEAVPHSAVVVDGKPLALTPAAGGTETGAAEIDVARQVTGMSPTLATLEREVPYVVTPPNGTPTSGQVKVRVGVTPLVVQAPGNSIVIETATFVLAGHTAKDASVSVEGRPITVDGTGAFAQMMSVSSLGETTITVRADAKDQAPRLVPVKVRRVQSLAAEAAAVRTRAATAYAAIEKASDAERGLAVALDGSVVESRADAFTTVLLIDVKNGCSAPPCLARITSGEKLVLQAGSGVSVFGAVTGSVDGPRPGSRIPAIAADFVLKGRP